MTVGLPPGGLLLLHTDGLGDRGGARGTESLALLREVPLAGPATVVDRVLAAVEHAGPAVDDVGVMVVRTRPAGAFPGCARG